MFLIKLAYQNIWRRPARTIASIIMISFGLVGLLFTQGIYRGMMDQILSDSIRTQTGHVTIYDHEYRKMKKISNTIENPKHILDFIEKDERVVAYFVRMVQNGMITTARSSRPANILGIDPENEKSFGRLNEYMESGSYEFDSENHEIIIGAELAGKLKTRVGKKIVLQTQAKDKTLVSEAYKVKGIIRTNNPLIDQSGVFLSQPQFNRLIGTKNEVHQISVMLKDEIMLDGFYKNISEFLPEDVKAYTWKKINPMAGMGRDMVQQMEVIIYWIIFIMVAIAIFDVVLISILERVREFGIMMAIGTKFSRIRNQVILESLVIGFLGFVSGGILGYLLLLYLKHYGINFEFAQSGMNKFGYATVMYAKLELEYFTSAFVATLIATGAASVVPIFILKRLKPMQAIYFT